MSTDRELLEAAAKAAGNGAQWDCPERGMMVLAPSGLDTMTWNPLTDDGDAFRLAVKLGLRIDTPKHKGFGSSCGNQTVFRDDPFEQTRLAIVRAAAALGASK